MLRLSSITDEISQDLERVVAVSKEFGMHGLEIRSVWDTPVAELSDAQAAEVKRIADEAKMTIPCVASPFFKCDIGDQEAGQKHLQILRRCIELAHLWNTRLIRVFAFWETGQTEQIWPQLFGRFQEPLKMAQEAGVILCFENEASTSLSTAKLTVQFISELRSSAAAALWDPANEVFAPGGEQPFPLAFHRMEPGMAHMHAKDAKRDEQGKVACTPIGEGEIDWAGQCQALVESGYDGYLSLETHWRPSKALSEELLNRPGGGAFSSLGEEASRICLENLIRLLEHAGWRRED